MLKHTLHAMGVEDDRVRLQWASAAEGIQLAEAINDMVEKVSALGPLTWSENWSEDGNVEAAIERLVEEHAEAMEVPA